ncbi:MAG: hypothetical protein QOI76_1072 [Frankiales bacterium]|nr:hypothetical protein [Frankiales bacterium]
MSEPTTYELQQAFDDLVGDPRPAADLAARARVRGTALRRQRVAGGLTAVAVIGALSVPGLALVRDQAQGGTAGTSVAGQPKASDTASADRKKTAVHAPGDKSTAADPASADKSRSASGVGPTLQTVIKPGVLTTADHARVDAAKALLGSGFTVENTDIAVDATSGAHLGAAVTFSATTGGGMVAVEWSTGEHSISGKNDATSAKLTPEDGPNGTQVSGAVLVSGNTEWDLKIRQGSAGSTPILATATAAAAFLNQLAGAASS